MFIPVEGPVPDPQDPDRLLQQAYTNPVGAVGAIPDTSIQAFYEHDSDTYKAMYECVPPEAENAFFSRPEKIEEAVRSGKLACLEPMAEVENYISEARAGRSTSTSPNGLPR